MVALAGGIEECPCKLENTERPARNQPALRWFSAGAWLTAIWRQRRALAARGVKLSEFRWQSRFCCWVCWWLHRFLLASRSPVFQGPLLFPLSSAERTRSLKFRTRRDLFANRRTIVIILCSISRITLLMSRSSQRKA